MYPNYQDKLNLVDQLLEARAKLLVNLDVLLESLNSRKNSHKNEAKDIFGLLENSQNNNSKKIQWKEGGDSISKLDLLIQEKTSLGLYISQNPIWEYKQVLEFLKEKLKIDLHLAILEKIKKNFTKNAQMMLILNLTLLDGEMEGIIFSKTALHFSANIEEKKLYWVLGRIDQKNNAESENTDIDTAIYTEKPKLLIENLVLFENLENLLDLPTGIKNNYLDKKPILLKLLNYLDLKILLKEPEKIQQMVVNLEENKNLLFLQEETPLNQTGQEKLRQEQIDVLSQLKIRIQKIFLDPSLGLKIKEIKNYLIKVNQLEDLQDLQFIKNSLEKIYTTEVLMSQPEEFLKKYLLENFLLVEIWIKTSKSWQKVRQNYLLSIKVLEKFPSIKVNPFGN